jgi:hypothetical protein
MITAPSAIFGAVTAPSGIEWAKPDEMIGVRVPISASGVESNAKAMNNDWLSVKHGDAGVPPGVASPMKAGNVSAVTWTVWASSKH